jgi:hypothetical protein
MRLFFLALGFMLLNEGEVQALEASALDGPQPETVNKTATTEDSENPQISLPIQNSESVEKTVVGQSSPLDGPVLKMTEPGEEIKNEPWSYAFTTSLGVPQPLSIGIVAKNIGLPKIDWFIEGGYFSFSFGEKKRTVSDYSIMLGARWHPFLNALYITGEVGYRDIGLSVDITGLQTGGTPIANTAEGKIDAIFLGLLVGGEFHITRRLALGMDLGIQYPFPLLHTGRVTIIANPGQSDGTDLSVDDQAAMKRISSIPLPQIALARFIWYL